LEAALLEKEPLVIEEPVSTEDLDKGEEG
jgi:hypothetical protein